MNGGTRTRDLRSHNPARFQLRHIHRKNLAGRAGFEPAISALKELRLDLLPNVPCTLSPGGGSRTLKDLPTVFKTAMFASFITPGCNACPRHSASDVQCDGLRSECGRRDKKEIFMSNPHAGRHAPFETRVYTVSPLPRFKTGADERSRTSRGSMPYKALNLARLPVSPHPHIKNRMPEEGVEPSRTRSPRRSERRAFTSFTTPAIALFIKSMNPAGLEPATSSSASLRSHPSELRAQKNLAERERIAPLTGLARRFSRPLPYR